MNDLDKIKELKQKAFEGNIFHNCNSNIPFYVNMKKPRPSLSKYDSERSSYWDYNDAIYIMSCVDYVEKLIKEQNE